MIGAGSGVGAAGPNRISGRYLFNGGADTEPVTAEPAVQALTHAERIDPLYPLERPVFIDDLVDRLAPSTAGAPRFTLHVDIDGPDPLNVVSGVVASGGVPPEGAPAHFVGRVTSETPEGGALTLAVDDFSFPWPESSDTIDRLVIVATVLVETPTLYVTFVASGPNRVHGPYKVFQESTWFRAVEIEVDVEDEAGPAEPYDTSAHPARPRDLQGQILTLEEVFGRLGVAITRSPFGGTIDSSAAGENRRWSTQELHDAMESHWSAFANRPQWKMWIFLAERSESDRLGGLMFDADIDEPGGVDRQGTAIFTNSPYFHVATGPYSMANPPADVAVSRELFFNLVHETGHTFNLLHSFSRGTRSAWAAPQWLPIVNDPLSLSWMNYPDRASPGTGNNAAWFYERFHFRFDDAERLFVRHAPRGLVQMGNQAGFQSYARVERGTLDRRLDLAVRAPTPIVELGQPVVLELVLHNVSDEPVAVTRTLDPRDGLVEVAITNPNRQRLPFLPFVRARSFLDDGPLMPGESLSEAVNLTMGKLGHPFKWPGPYRVEVSYTNRDGSTAAAVTQLHVRPPTNYEDGLAVTALFTARVGRVLDVGGTRLMPDVNDRLDWVKGKLAARNPVVLYLDVMRAMPFAQPYKALRAEATAVEVLDPDPDYAARLLGPWVADGEQTADVVGPLFHREIVDSYTRAQIMSGHVKEAADAQRRLLKLLRRRKVVGPVVREVQERLADLTELP